MNKPITEKDFDALTEKIIEDAGQYVYMSCNVTEQYFELAKRMAIDFQRWISKNNFFEGADFQKGIWFRNDGECVAETPEQLFELYQQQNNA